MKNKFLAATALACAVSFGAPAVASASAADFDGTSRWEDRITSFSFEMPEVEVPEVDYSPFAGANPYVRDDAPTTYTVPSVTAFTWNSGSGASASASASASNGSSAFASATSSSVTTSNGTTTTSSSYCEVNGVEVECVEATAPRFDWASLWD